MLTIIGKYTTAKIYTENVEQEAISQIYGVCNHPIFKDMPVRIMPDVHAGKGCVIGFTAQLKDKVIPNLIGVDIGCGMLTVNLGKSEIDLVKLDNFIRKEIPHGNNVNDKFPNISHAFEADIKEVCERIKDENSFNRHLKSLGSLGGGNHFIEISKDSAGNQYLIIHSGSRNFGHKIATFYQRKAVDYCDSKRRECNDNINKIKGAMRVDDFYPLVEDTRRAYEVYKVDKDLSYLEGKEAEDYLQDMKVAQRFASLNRILMATKISDFLGYSSLRDNFETIHNYIDDNGLIRKGAISAFNLETVLIPMNMRDGSLLCRGKGNTDWNCSAPHGAGRIMSRAKAKSLLSIEEFQEQMKDVYTTSVSTSTLDESPMSYKPMQEIINNVGDTVEILDILKPIYNFKSP